MVPLGAQRASLLRHDLVLGENCRACRHRIADAQPDLFDRCPALDPVGGHPDRGIRQLWAALAALWIPGLHFASEARPYALLFLLACAQAIAFLHLLRVRAAGLVPALIWAGISALAILTHYHALFITGLQGIAYLIFHRSAALRNWPAILVFAPVFAWMYVHLPFVLSLVDPAVTWYTKLGVASLAYMPFWLFGVGFPAACLLALISATGAAQTWQAVVSGTKFPSAPADVILVATGMAACMIVLGIGFVRPSFVARYLTPFVPAILLGIALWARNMESQCRHASLALVAIFIALATAERFGWLTNSLPDLHDTYNFEQPSAWLRSHGVERLVFLWDNPVAMRIRTTHLEQVGGFFLHREGAPVPVSVPSLSPDDDPNLSLVAAADGPKTAILWAYDIGVAGTRGIAHPSRIAQINPDWTCRDFGGGTISVVACIRLSPA